MDRLLSRLIRKEIERQEKTIDLIPSENIASPELLRILGSPLTNKYAEGYAGSRYYPGNQYIDDLEQLAKQRARSAFGLSEKTWSVNVQPYSGSPANQAVYFALAKPGETLMGLKLSHGGHLTHGHPVSFSGRTYRAVYYELGTDGFIDYHALEALAKRERPRIIVSGATAYPRIIDFKRFDSIARAVGAYHVADISHIAGLVAAGVHPAPFDYADVVTTTTHKTLRGPRGAVIFARNTKIKDQNSKLTVAEAIDRAVFPGLQGGPHMNVIAGIAWTFGAVTTPRFRSYARQVLQNARSLGAELVQLGFTLLSGGTENHLLLLDLRGTAITGSEAEEALESVGIIANRNSVPGDEKPFRPSGIRMGTPAVTTRGMGVREMKAIAELVHRTLVLRDSPQTVRRDVQKLLRRFPLPYSQSQW